MFGSTGSKVKILEFMEQVDTRAREYPAEDSDSDSDSEDGEERINIRAPNMEQSFSKVSEEERSTHFLAVKVNSKELSSNLVKVQQSLVAREQILQDCCMKEELFHMTLGMFRLRDIQGIQLAVDMVRTIKDEAPEIIQGRDTLLEVDGLNNFGHRVVYAQVKPKDPQLFQDFLSFIRRKFESIGDKVQSTNSFEFVPHITLAKVSRPISRIRRSQYIDESFYAHHKNEYFGSQRLDNLQLCIIETSTRFDGFYTTLEDVNI